MTVNAGSGNDTFNVSPVAMNLNTIQGSLTLNGGDGTDAVNLYDIPFIPFTLTPSTFFRPGAALISFFNVESLTLNGSPLPLFPVF